FRQRRPGLNGEWIYNLEGVRRVLYRLRELFAARKDEWVFIVEGERDADRMAKCGLVATTNPGGAGKWRSEYNENFKNRRVAILPHNDDAGRKHMRHVAPELLSVAFCVKIVKPPGLPQKGDVSHWLDAGGTMEQLLTLVDAAKPVILGDLDEPFQTPVLEPPA